MIENSIAQRTTVPVVRITSELTPRGARLTAHRSIGAALHTLDHQFSKSTHEKSSWEDANPNPLSQHESRGAAT